MAEAATFEQLLALFPSEVADLMRRSDELIRSSIPVGASAVSLGQKNVRYGPRMPVKMDDIILVMNPMRDRVNLNFGNYDTLPDPTTCWRERGRGSVTSRSALQRTSSDRA